MVSTSADTHGSAPPVAFELAERKMPPIQAVAVVVMAFALAGGIDVAAYLPRRPSLGLPIGLLAAAGALLVANFVQLARLADFAWHVFWRVVGWTSLAYVVIAGMIEYVMVYDGTRGSLLLVMSALIVLFAVDIPLLLGFSVARYQEARAAA